MRDGLSSNRLTEVMRRDDERGEHDSGIQIQNRLTLLECVSLSKSSYSVSAEHARTHKHTPTSPTHTFCLTYFLVVLFFSVSDLLHVLSLFKDSE